MASRRRSSNASTVRERRWLHIQHDTFLRWVNWHLEDRNMFAVSLIRDFRDGVRLVNLIEILDGEVLLRYYPVPQDKSECLFNVKAALEHLDKAGGLLVPIKPHAIVAGDAPIILSLVWCLVLHYKFDHAWRAWDELMEWTNEMIGPGTKYNRHVKNFTTDWRDGQLLATLVDACKHECLGDINDFEGDDPEAVAELAISVAAEELNVPPVLTPEDLVNPNCDELSIITYLCMFQHAYIDFDATAQQDRTSRGSMPPALIEVSNQQATAPRIPSYIGEESEDDDETEPSESEDSDRSNQGGSEDDVDDEDDLQSHHEHIAAPPSPSGPDMRALAMEAVALPRQVMSNMKPVPFPQALPTHHVSDSDIDEVAQDDGDDQSEAESEHRISRPASFRQRQVGPSGRCKPTGHGLEVYVTEGPASAIETDASALGVRRGLSYIPTIDPTLIANLDESKRVYKVHVTWNGKPVAGSPFMVDSAK